MSRRLGDVADIHYGKSPKDVLDEDGSVPVVGTGGLYGLARDSLFTGPAVVVPRKGSLGNPQYVEGRFWPVDTTFAVLPKRGFDARWLYYSLAIFDLTRLNEATGVPSISRDWLYKVPVSDADTSEQLRIAEILSTTDEAIEQTEALIAKTEQIKVGMMADLFTRGVTANGQFRPTHEEAPKFYKESPLGWIPREWTVSTVGQFLYGIDAGHSPECPDTPAQGEQWGVLKVGAVNPKGFREEENKTVLDPRLHDSSLLVRAGDLLLSRANTIELVGLVCHVHASPRNLMLSDKTLRLRTIRSQVQDRFLFWSLQLRSIRRQIENAASGTSGSMKNISQQSIRALRLGLPDLEEQTRIAARMDAAAMASSALIHEQSKLRQLRVGLMRDLLPGEACAAVVERKKAAADV